MPDKELKFDFPGELVAEDLSNNQDTIIPLINGDTDADSASVDYHTNTIANDQNRLIENTELPTSPLTHDTLIERVMSELGPRKRMTVPRDMVEASIQTLNLSRSGAVSRPPVPRLRVERLVFTGYKTLDESEPVPFRYDQTFAPGVNIVLVEKNHAGKSSILKTIKYALTGDDSDYEVDVREWIRNIWLQFSLDSSSFTVHLDRSGDRLSGYISAGAENRGMEDISSAPFIMERIDSTDSASEILNTFFLKRLGLNALGWTQKANGGSERRNASWRTFFQALLIPDGSDEYLICDTKHAMGGQHYIIMSEFLGLSYSEALNQLLIEKQTATKANAASEEEVRQAEKDAASVEAEIKAVERNLQDLDQVIFARRSAVQTNEIVIKLSELQSLGVVRVQEIQHLKNEHVKLNEQIRQRRARAQRLREAIEIQRHFTSLEVRKCPRCTTDVDEDAVEREKTQHTCRVCGKEANTASRTEVEAMQAEADALIQQVEADVRVRDRLNEDIRKVEDDVEQMSRNAGLLEGAAKEGWEFALPTSEEESTKLALLERLGGLRYQLGALKRRAGEHSSAGQEADLKADVHEVVRKTLRAVAEEQNQDVLATLGTLTQKMTRTFGAASVTDVSCSAVGSLSLKKNGEPVTFKHIRNSGERMRIKLAFFIALMLLGRLGGGASRGRHPGLLLIDQPASAEMVTEHIENVAHALNLLNNEYSEHLQIICFTTESTFQNATIRNKIYGPQAPPNAF